MTEAEKKRRQHKKELHSLRNKMVGKNLVWFDSLPERSQYDILFAWKREKKFNNRTTKICEARGMYILFPINFKYFIFKMKRKYKPLVSRIREATIDLLLNNKK